MNRVTIIHLTASRFFGGPERQMLQLCAGMPREFRSVIASFSEDGLAREFLDRVRDRGLDAVELRHDTPRLAAAVGELKTLLRETRAVVLCCHGYKANLLGLAAARQTHTPIISVSRGWTAENLKIRAYEVLDKLSLRWMDHVVCVSRAQQEKVRRAGVPAGRTTVIHNAVRAEADTADSDTDASFRERLDNLFAEPPDMVVGAAGRLSPEKGFGVLIDAATRVTPSDVSVGFVLFGEGSLRENLKESIEKQGLRGRFVLAGFRPDLRRYLPHLDLLVLPSFTEGLPNIALEASAAGLAIVGTNAGGTPEVVDHGTTGYLVPPGDPDTMARRIAELLADTELRCRLGTAGRERVADQFSFHSQSVAYQRLFGSLGCSPSGATRLSTAN